MSLIFGAAILYTATLVVRGLFLDSKVALCSPKFWFPLLICLIANGIAFCGFWILANTPAVEPGNYESILSVLALLSAGVISGNFSFTHQESAEDENFLVSLIACFFVLLFYLIFTGVCFYSGKSTEIYSAPYATQLIPTIVFLVLMTNTFYEFWDHRTSG